MDLSRIPNRDNDGKSAPPAQPAAQPPTTPTPPGQTPPQQAVYVTAPPQEMPAGLTAFFSVAIGLGYLYMYGSRFVQWMAHKLFGSEFTWTFTDANNNPLQYPETGFFVVDIASVAVVVAFLLDAVAALVPWRPVRWLCLSYLGGTLAFSAVAVMYSLSKGFGPPLPLLMATFGLVYFAWIQWTRLAPRPRPQ